MHARLGSIIAALLLAPSVALATGNALWWSDDWSCSGKCCMKGKTKDGKDCVLYEETRLPTPDAATYEIVHRILKRVPGGKPMTSQWGLADEKGKTLIAPRPGYMLPISSRVVVYARDIGRDFVVVDAKGERETDWVGVDTAWIGGGWPAHFAVLKQHADGRRDEAPILRDGTLGPTLTGVVPNGIFPVGSVAVITMEAEPGGPRSSVFVDGKGKIVWAGREVAIFGGPNLPWDKGHDTGDLSWVHVAMALVGPSPLAVPSKLPYVYAPLDERGQAIPLPHGVVGFVPLDLRRPVRAQYAPDDVWSWLIVSKTEKGYEYRVGGPGDGRHRSPLEFVKQDGLWSQMAVVDAVRFAKSGHPSGHFADGEGVLVAHRVAQKDWVVRGAMNDFNQGSYENRVRPRNPDYIPADDGFLEGVGPTPEAAAWDAAAKRAVTLDAMAGKIAAMNQQAEEAKRRAPAERRAQLETWFDTNERSCTMTINTPASICSGLEAAAIELGAPRLDRWFAAHGRIYAGDHSLPPLDAVCGKNARGCELLKARYAVLADRAKEERKKQEIRELYWQRVSVQYLKGTGEVISVTWEVDGRLVTEAMTVDEFDRRMKERMSK